MKQNSHRFSLLLSYTACMFAYPDGAASGQSPATTSSDAAKFAPPVPPVQVHNPAMVPPIDKLAHLDVSGSQPPVTGEGPAPAADPVERQRQEQEAKVREQQEKDDELGNQPGNGQ